MRPVSGRRSAPRKPFCGARIGFSAGLAWIARTCARDSRAAREGNFEAAAAVCGRAGGRAGAAVCALDSVACAAVAAAAAATLPHLNRAQGFRISSSIALAGAAAAALFFPVFLREFNKSADHRRR